MVQSKREVEPGSQSDTEEESEEEEYQVAEILGKRYRKGKVEYLIRWLDWGPEVDSWEPLEHLGNCSQLISDYEKELMKARLKRMGKEEVQIKSENVNGKDLSHVSSDSENEDVRVFYQSLKNFELEKITGAYRKDEGQGSSSSTLMFEVKWRHSDELGAVPAKVANIKWPEKVIQYYESICHWEVDGVKGKNGWVPNPIHGRGAENVTGRSEKK